MQTLLIDSNYLCYRSFFTTGSMKSGGLPTGVIYGFLRDMVTLQDRFSTNNLIFCFDHGRGLREKAFPFYKAKRREKQKQDIAKTLEYEELREQICELKEQILPELGITAICYTDGYEADDVIASFVFNNLDHANDLVIVSGDKDLYQLLLPGVTMFNPRGEVTMNRKRFKKEYGIPPCDWPEVKAIAGCVSDDIPGIKGVGEKTALKYMQWELNEKLASYKKIRESRELIERNLKLIKLPYEGCPVFKIPTRPMETINQKLWKQVMDRFDIKSLRSPRSQRGLLDG